LNELFQLGIGFIVGLSGALIPGPMLIFVITRTMSDGPKAGPMTAFGHMIVEFGILIAIVLGLNLILQDPPVQGVVGLLGGVLLIIFGLTNVIKSRKISVKSNTLGNFKYGAIVGGIAFSSILNPSVPLWWGTVGLAMMMEAFLTTSILGAALWFVGHLLSDLTWYSFISYMISKRKKFREERIYKIIIVACGLVLIFLGASFIIKYGPSIL
jgi:threonine/homoserine/homoserine lactone efflux protein